MNIPSITSTQLSNSSMKYEPTIPASERPQTYALGHAVTGIGYSTSCTVIKVCQQHRELFVTLTVLMGKATDS